MDHTSLVKYWGVYIPPIPPGIYANASSHADRGGIEALEFSILHDGTNSFNNLQVFQTVMIKHQTFLIFSLLPIVTYTLTQSLPLLAPLTTVLLLSLLPMHHLPFPPLLAVFGTLTKFSALSSLISSLISPGGTICLLYTSPSPRDGLLSRMPSSA